MMGVVCRRLRCVPVGFGLVGECLWRWLRGPGELGRGMGGG